MHAQPQIFPQDCLHRNTLELGAPCPYHADRHPACRVPVRTGDPCDCHAPNRTMHRENLKHEAKITLPVPSQSSIFGVPLEDLMGRRGEKGVPKVVRDCIQFLRETGVFHVLFSDFH